MTRAGIEWMNGAVVSGALLGLTGCELLSPTDDALANAATETPAAELESDIDAQKVGADGIIIAGFEEGDTGYTVSADKASFERISDGDGNGAIAATYQVTGGISRIQIRPDTLWDWSELENFNLAVDLENIGDVSAQVYIGVVDSDGTFLNKSNVVPAGESLTMYHWVDAPAADYKTGMREFPAAWDKGETMAIYRWGDQTPGNLNLSEIAEINIFIRGAIRERNVTIDNLRLRPNPEKDTDWLVGIVDALGQNAKADYPTKVDSDEELKAAANAELAELAANPVLPDRSRFGGWKDGPQLEGTGYFRVEKVDGQWWYVDPEGYLFFSNALANIRIANLQTMTGVDFKDDSVRYVDPNEVTPEDSIGVVTVSDEVRETAYIASDIRRDMFNWLPDYDDPLANHYGYRRTVRKGALDSGETFSFYRANLERRYGETEPDSFMRKWERVTLDRMKSWGFTSFGNWVDPAFYPNEEVAYFANGWIIGDYQVLTAPGQVWGPMPDFYDPKFKERAVATISVVADEVQGSPWCVGVFIDNEKSWGERGGGLEDRYGILYDALSKSADESFAKAAFTKMLKEKYESIEALNAAWGLEVESWDAFKAGVVPEGETDGLAADLSMMMEDYSDQYFRIVDETLEEYLPNHLYMGARMASWGMPDETVTAALKYSDVMSFNIYQDGLSDEAWGFLQDLNKPVQIGEFHFGAISDTGLYHHGLIMSADQADRARMYKDYLKSVTTNPALVGAHWFQYTDSPLTGRAFDGENYNVGFVSNTDIPYPEMVEAAREVNTALYPDRFAQTAD